MTLPAFQTQIYVVGALTLNFTDSVGAKTADLDAGTYDSIHDAASNLAANMTAASADTITITVSTVTATIGKVTFASTGSPFEIDWFTNGSGECDDVGNIFGFDVTADDIGSTSYESDYQHAYGWYPTHVPARDTGDRRHYVGGATRLALSGKKVKRLYVGTRYRRIFDFELIEPEYTFTADATTTNTNKDFEQFWATAVQGYTIQYYPDRTVTGTKTTYYLEGLEDFLEEISRPHDDLERYNFRIPLIRQET